MPAHVHPSTNSWEINVPKTVDICFVFLHIIRLLKDQPCNEYLL